MDSDPNTPRPKRLRVSVAPPSPEVEYFVQKQIAINLTSNSADQLLVESVTLRFQSDTDVSAIYVEQSCGWEIQHQGVTEQVVTISPTPLYLAGTNLFDVMVIYRIFEREGLSRQPLSEIHRGSYLILKNSTAKLGQVFVSFKQGEDLVLARIMGRLATRAGFSPYLALHDAQPGTHLWDRIEPAIRDSVAMFVIWTKHTAWGSGVQREIEMSRKHRVPHVLLIECSVPLPEGYDETFEYQRFDPEDPAPAFSKAIVARRRIILEHKAEEGQ